MIETTYKFEPHTAPHENTLKNTPQNLLGMFEYFRNSFDVRED